MKPANIILLPAIGRPFPNINLQKTIKNLRSVHGNEKRVQTIWKYMKVSTEPAWSNYKQLKFLSPFVNHRQTKGNFNDVAKENESEAINSLQVFLFHRIDPSESRSVLNGAVGTNLQCNLESSVRTPSSPVSERASTPFEKTPCLPGPKRQNAQKMIQTVNF